MPIITFTPAEQAAIAKAELEHVVTAESTDAQLNAKANRCAYSTGTGAWTLFQIFALQREVAVLKNKNTPPHLRNVEHRG
ncbi:MAG TPA: hypothetical protein VGK22_03815 [Candidatus Angelobacter sp.]|jgi:hypothetical protein